MKAFPIERRHWVRPDAPMWLSGDGETLAQCVASWVDTQVELDRLPSSPVSMNDLLTGDVCGWVEEAGTPVAVVALTQAAMSVCIDEIGIECATPVGLHHVLTDLVIDGYLAPVASLLEEAGTGAVLLYRLDAAKLGLQVAR